MTSDWYPASGPGRTRKEAEISDKGIILRVFLSVVTCIWACSLQGLWKQNGTYGVFKRCWLPTKSHVAEPGS